MPQRSLITLSLALILSFPAVALAELKVGYVDLQRALLEVQEGREAKKRLQVQLDAKQKDLDREQEALRKEKEVLDKQASMMSEETRNQRQIDLQKKLFELAQRWEKGKLEMAQMERTELQAIFQKMDPIIAQIAEREGLTMVFEKTDSGIVYAPQSLDLTNELVRLYNDRSKSSPKPKDKPAKPDAPKADAPKADAPKK
ncbi:MAG: OmpH family outer membrane protein [Myxococcales bacterium]|nr:OmpH family outer membrane protein [Myxococcales bacterium]